MKQRNLSTESARLARRASSDLANLQRAMRSADDTLSGLHRVLKVPNTNPRRHTIKKQVSKSGLLSAFAAIGLGSLSGLTGGTASFYRSTRQLSADLVNLLTGGQRIL